jgi:hypothetical protein
MKQAVRTNDRYGTRRIAVTLTTSLLGLISLASCITYYPVSYRTHQFREGDSRNFSKSEQWAQERDSEGAHFYENYFAEKAAQLGSINDPQTFTDVESYSSGAATTYAPLGQNADQTRITINQFNPSFGMGWGGQWNPFFFNDPYINPWINPWFDPFFGPVFGPSDFWFNGMYNRSLFYRNWGFGYIDPFWGRPFVYGFNPNRSFLSFNVRPRVVQGYRSGPTRSNPYNARENFRGRSNQLPTRSSYTPQSNLRNRFQQPAENTYQNSLPPAYRNSMPSGRSNRNLQQPIYNRSKNSLQPNTPAPSRSSSPNRSGSSRSSSSRSNSRGNN